MNKLTLYSCALVLMFSCTKKIETCKPTVASITESIYASGTLKSKNQYQAFVTVNGNISTIYVSEGDSVRVGSPILSISNETQRLNRDNAALTAEFADINSNSAKINEAKVLVNLAKEKLTNDSNVLARQKALWKENVGTKVELEAKELTYLNSKASYYSAKVKLEDLTKQLKFNSSQSKKNLLISSKIERDYTLKSEIDGVVYSLFKTKGEIVTPQTPLAIIGDKNTFILEMQVDEKDILKIEKGLRVLVTMDSYKDSVFDAMITKIFPIMNERSKTFLVEAEFVKKPFLLYPNISFEANIIISIKEKALLIPRNYLIDDCFAIKKNGDTIAVTTGLKDYQKIEIISGISSEDELQKPSK